MQKASFIVLFVLLNGCAMLENLHQRQAVKYIQKHGAIIRTDTTHDTVFVNIPGAKTDTVFKVTPGQTDTFKMILDNRVFTTIYKNREGDSLKVNQHLIDQKTQAVNTTIEREIFTAAKNNSFFIRFVIVAALVCAFLLALARTVSSFRR
jgi:hypothetical protein